MSCVDVKCCVCSLSLTEPCAGWLPAPALCGVSHLWLMGPTPGTDGSMTWTISALVLASWWVCVPGSLVTGNWASWNWCNQCNLVHWYDLNTSRLEGRHIKMMPSSNSVLTVERPLQNGYN